MTAAIDKAVDGVIANLQAADSALSPDLLKITKFTLEFLEACGKMGDPQFRTHIKTRASELHNELSMAAAKAAAKAGPPVDPNAKTYASFEPAYSDYFCEFLGLRLRAFQIAALHIPSHRSKAPSPHASNAASSTSVSLVVRRR